jgi:hypothetical protein
MNSIREHQAGTLAHSMGLHEVQPTDESASSPHRTRQPSGKQAIDPLDGAAAIPVRMTRDSGSEDDMEVLIDRAVSALATEFLQRQLPRVQAIQADLAAGDSLSAEDAAFVSEMLESLASAAASFDGSPELAALHRCAASLYDDVMTQAFVAPRPKRGVG